MHVLQAVLQHAEHVVVAHCLIQLLHVLLQLFRFLDKEVHIDFAPWGAVPVAEREHDGSHHVPQRLQVQQLFIAALQH